MKNTNIFKLFNVAVKWNAFESLAYQTILTIHQIAFFYVAGCAIYGVTGVLYSLLYLCVLILNFGYDKSLLTFYDVIKVNKSNFKKIFIYQLIFQIILLISCSLILIYFQKNLSILFSKFFKCPNLPENILTVLSILLILESLKKTIRNLAELKFLNKQIALVEISLILIFTCLFWGNYILGHQPDLYLVFIPHLIQAFLGLIIYLWLLIKKIYNYIPLYSDSATKPYAAFEILKIRFSNFVFQISHMFFSGNFIIPFLSSIFGIWQISFLKLTNVIIVFFTVIFERTFGLTSGALLSNLKKRSLSIRQKSLEIATKKFFLIFYGIIIILIINFKTFFKSYYQINIENFDWLPIYLFLLIMFFENFFLVYEQYFIVEAKTFYLIMINYIAAVLFYGTTYFNNLSLNTTLSCLIFIRVLSFLALKKISFIKLKIRLPYKINLKYIIVYLCYGIIIFIFLKLFNR